MRPKTQRKIKGVSDTARTLIQQAPPYNRTPNVDDPLVVLHKMDVPDKHRLLRVTPSRVSNPMMYVNRAPEDIVIEMTSTGGGLSSEASTPLARLRPVTPDPQMKVNPYPSFSVVFPKYGAVDNKPVAEAIKELSDFTTGLINSAVGMATHRSHRP